MCTVRNLETSATSGHWKKVKGLFLNKLKSGCRNWSEFSAVDRQTQLNTSMKREKFVTNANLNYFFFDFWICPLTSPPPLPLLLHLPPLPLLIIIDLPATLFPHRG